MIALTIKQPWAHLIIHGGKDIENCDWWTSVRGRVAIHCSAKLDVWEWMQAECLLADLRAEGKSTFLLPTAALIPTRGGGRKFSEPPAIPVGCVIGTVDIVDCVSKSNSQWFFGKYGFVLRDPIAFEAPVPCKGSLGFWEWPQPPAHKSEVRP